MTQYATLILSFEQTCKAPDAVGLNKAILVITSPEIRYLPHQYKEILLCVEMPVGSSFSSRHALFAFR